MTDRKREKLLFIDMGFDETNRRFAQSDKKESDELAKCEKSKKKPGKPKALPAVGLIGITVAAGAAHYL